MVEEIVEVHEASGRIIKVQKDGGWGFISSRDIPFQRIFFHWTVVKGFDFAEIERGMTAKFSAKKDDTRPKGEQWRATRVYDVEVEKVTNAGT